MKPMKKHKFKILTFVAVAAALAGTGCFKSIGYETFYVLRPWAQEGTVKTPIPGKICWPMPSTRTQPNGACSLTRTPWPE